MKKKNVIQFICDNHDDPIHAIKLYIGIYDLRPVDLVDVIGSSTSVSEVLNKKRYISARMIRAVHKKFDIPLDLLMKDYELE